MASTEKKKRNRKEPEKHPALKTGDEIMDDLFSPEVREKLKELAHEKRPKEEK